MDLLRFNTCGSVDDGKSTLIGRLLHDSRSLMDDQLDALARPGGPVDLAALTDGLRAEREQGITIDVAYRHFATPRRRFIVADTPGHVQYTRNMVTGASTAGLSVILVDARRGVTEQTRRHAFLAALLGVPQLVVAINKMDLVGWSESRFREIRAEVEDFLARLGGAREVWFVPLSALDGDNVVEPSAHAPWHAGPTLLAHLESVHVAGDASFPALRLPVQWVNRPRDARDPALHDFRGLAGQLAGGTVRVGQEVLVLPGGQPTRVREIHGADGPCAEASCPESVTVVLADDLDVARGDLLVDPAHPPAVGTELEASVCWMDARPLQPGRPYLLKLGTQTVPARVAIQRRVNISTFAEEEASTLAMNDIGRVRVQTAKPVAWDAYRENRRTGAFILIDPATNQTVAAGMAEAPAT